MISRRVGRGPRSQWLPGQSARPLLAWLVYSGGEAPRTSAHRSIPTIIITTPRDQAQPCPHYKLFLNAATPTPHHLSHPTSRPSHSLPMSRRVVHRVSSVHSRLRLACCLLRIWPLIWQFERTRLRCRTRTRERSSGDQEPLGPPHPLVDHDDTIPSLAFLLSFFFSWGAA